MKPEKLVIHLATHVPTGAEIPMVVNALDSNNVITDYQEFMQNRKGFTLHMLQDRWDLCRDDALDLLQRYQVPAHIDHTEVRKLEQGAHPVDVAIFFEEYVFGIEKKEGMKHNKLKSKKLQAMRDH